MPDLSRYFDHSATTPVAPEVLQAMQPFYAERFGNPSSLHQWGQEAEAAVEMARQRVASLLGCLPEEILFTSGATESNNLGLRGLARIKLRTEGKQHLLTTPVEHPSVLNTLRDLEAHEGFELELLPIDAYGRVSPDEVAMRLRPETALVSIIYASNEIGSVNPIAEIGEVCRQASVPFHTDAVQAVNYLPMDVNALQVDMLPLSAHKFYGPKGIGILYHRNDLGLEAVQTGGGQERQLRAGTHNVPSIVGLAHALSLARERSEEHATKYRQWRDQIIAEILDRLTDVRLTGHPTARLPNHISFALRAVDSNALLAALDLAGFACSSGSACKAGMPEPSRVLQAIGLEPEWSLGALRITLGASNDEASIRDLIESLVEIVPRVRATSAQDQG